DFRRRYTRYQLWVPMLVTTLVFGSLGILAFRFGRNEGYELALRERPNPATVRAEVSSSPETKPRADSGTSARDVEVAALRREVANKAAELARLKTAQSEQQAILRANSADTQSLVKQLTEERDRLQERVSATEEALHATEVRL